MTHGFFQRNVKFLSADGRNDTLLEPLQFKSAAGPTSTESHPAPPPMA